MIFSPKYQKVYDMHHCSKEMQIRCKKSAGTKMHKCLVTILPNNYSLIAAIGVPLSTVNSFN